MARFGRDFVRAATQPAYTQGLFTAAQQVGSAPARRRELDRELERFNQTSRVEGQADASVVAGDPNALAMNIRRLQELMEQAPTMEEKRALNAKISRLRGLTLATEAKGLQNEIRAVSTIDNTLETLDTTTEQGMKVKDALEARKIQLLQNPDVEQGYREAQVNEFKFKEAERAMKEQEYILGKAKDFNSAIASGDNDQVQAVLSTVPPEFAAVAQQYVTGAIRNNEVMNQFNERSIAMKTAPMTDSEIDSIVQGLPENVRVGIAAQVAAYKEAAKGWSDETQWSGSTLAYNKAKQAEKALRDKAASLSERALFADLAEKSRVAAEERAIVRRAEVDLFRPITESARKNRAQQITDEKDGEPTREDYILAEQQLRQENIDYQLSIINQYNPERAAELGYEEDTGSPYTVGQVIESEDGTFVYLGGDFTDKNNYRLATKDEKDKKYQAGFEEIVVVPTQAVAEVLKEKVGEPISEFADLASARKKVGKAFRDYGGVLEGITTDELILVLNSSGFEKHKPKIREEINRRMSGG
jgi:hypothetical protein